MTEKWGWLKDYINEVRAAQGFGAITGVKDDAPSKYEAAAFFISGQSQKWPKGADFSEAGKEENYLPKFVASYETPFAVVGEFNSWKLETALDMSVGHER